LPSPSRVIVRVIHASTVRSTHGALLSLPPTVSRTKTTNTFRNDACAMETENSDKRLGRQ
jgi:hypothetical protein